MTARSAARTALTSVPSASSVRVASLALSSLLLGSLVLAGCGGDAKPPASPSSTSASSPTTTAPPTTSPTTDPNIPVAARAHTPTGAEAFVRYFYERLNVAWTTPASGILSPLCQPSAVACAANEKTANRLTTQGHRYDGNPLTLKFIGALDSTTPNHLNVLANVVQERRSEVDATGKVYATDERKDLRLNFDLLYTGQAWSVASTKLMK